MVQISSDDVTRGMPRGQLKRKVRLHVFSFKRRFIAEMFSALVAFFFFELMQITKTTATTTSPNKTFNKQNNNVLYGSCYISSPSSATQQQKMTKFWIVT